MGLPALVGIIIKMFTAANALRISTIQEDLFIQGKSFTSRQIVVAPNAGQIDILIDARVCTCNQIVFAPLSFIADEGPITVELYVGVTISALGTLKTIFNRRSTSPTKNRLKIYSGPTVSDVGIKFSELLIPASSAAIFINGSQSGPGLPFEINKELLYMARIINNNGADANVEYNATWFEI